MKYFVICLQDDQPMPPDSFEVTYCPETDSWGRVIRRKWMQVDESYPLGTGVPAHQGYEGDIAYTDPFAESYKTVA